ncbi:MULTISPECIES: HGxxPAAW family protein [unclassified Streptomyces]|uniref:HGxxPAAW family protein n=1 Tax=unclassified Streptomyces TaxID=2593676 RepID=UPI00325502D0
MNGHLDTQPAGQAKRPAGEEAERRPSEEANAHRHDEGHTVAGWAGFAVATGGAIITGLGICGRRPGIWLGICVLASAALVTWGLHLAGWGKPPGPRASDLRGRDRAARNGHADCLGCRMAGQRGVPAHPAVTPEPTVTPAEAPSPADL